MRMMFRSEVILNDSILSIGTINDSNLARFQEKATRPLAYDNLFQDTITIELSTDR